jgi:hypothetical protein
MYVESSGNSIVKLDSSNNHSILSQSQPNAAFVQLNSGMSNAVSLNVDSTGGSVYVADQYGNGYIKMSAGSAGTGPQSGYALVYDGSNFRPQKITTDPMTSTSFAAIITTDVGA